jgi:uncharacterized protein YbbK (DUF523 family)
MEKSPKMRKPAKPRVVVSKCLGFAACRYDGTMAPDAFVEGLKGRVTFCPVCPEMEIGLGCPRDPIRIVLLEGNRRLVQPSTGKDLTARMRRFSRRFLDSLGRVDGFILKARSPSCGIRDTKIFAGPDDRAPIAFGSGLLAEAVLERFPGLAIEDEVGLNDRETCREFLARLFACGQP